LDHDANIQVYDPLGMEYARRVLGDRVAYSSSAEECLKNAGFCVIAILWDDPWIMPSDFTKNVKHAVVLECWRIEQRS